uniref:Conodipine n=1 Tax=Conus ermineus TaxID=55423 RepID=A0A346CJ86_CONER|nr:conodipine [Conus ermineus]
MKVLESALWILAALALPRIAALDSSTAELCRVNSNACSVPFKWIPCQQHFLPACDRHDTCYHCGGHFSFKQGDCDDAFFRDMEALCAQGTDEGFCPDKRKRRDASSTAITTRQLRLLEKFMPPNFFSDRDPRQPHPRAFTCNQWVSVYFRTVQVFGWWHFNYRASAKECPPFEPCMPEVGSTA